MTLFWFTVLVKEETHLIVPVTKLSRVKGAIQDSASFPVCTFQDILQEQGGITEQHAHNQINQEKIPLIILVKIPILVNYCMIWGPWELASVRGGIYICSLLQCTPTMIRTKIPLNNV